MTPPADSRPRCFRRCASRTPSNIATITLLMFSIACMCSALGQVSWLHQSSRLCSDHHLAPYQFFDFGYFEEDITPTGQVFMRYHCAAGTLDCLTPEFVLRMRVVITVTFLAILCGLIGFYVEIASVHSKSFILRRFRAIPELLMLSFVLSVMIVTYSASKVLARNISHVDRIDRFVLVRFEYGFWTVCAAAVLAVLATASIFADVLLAKTRSMADDGDNIRLLDDHDDSPPPYSVSGNLQPPPPPPYSP